MKGERMNKKGTITIVGSMAGLSAGIVAAIRAAEKSGANVVCIPEPEMPKLPDNVTWHELKKSLDDCRDLVKCGPINEPWRNRPKREKYRR